MMRVVGQSPVDAQVVGGTVRSMVPRLVEQPGQGQMGVTACEELQLPMI